MALKEVQKSLKRWTKQGWRTASGKSSETGEVYAPAKTIAALKASREGRKNFVKPIEKKKNCP